MAQNIKFKEAEYRENQIGTQFLSCPLDNCTYMIIQAIRVFLNGEIVSAENFPESELYLVPQPDSFPTKSASLKDGKPNQANNSKPSSQANKNQNKQIACTCCLYDRESITQATLPIMERKEGEQHITKFYFCFPVDLQLLSKFGVVEWPVFHFQVFSNDKWGRIRMHGCGFIKVPSTPGYHLLHTETWKPYIDHKSKITQYYLGGILKTKNLPDISKQQSINQLDEPGPINRFCYKAISSGRINMRLNVAIQSRDIKNSQRVLYRDQKYSEQTEIKKKDGLTVPGLVNTGQSLGGRYTNTRLQ